MENKQVKVYSTPTCPWCKKVKQFLDANGINYQDLNVAEDKAAREEMISTTHQMAVPTISIDGEYVIGYNEKELKEKLAIK
ncbi:MAG: glutaredoxin family protein [Dehalococcoidales bacterium]|nr:glutaredoxin family protein [Dehalococcoidales bacterium]